MKSQIVSLAAAFALVLSGCSQEDGGSKASQPEAAADTDAAAERENARLEALRQDCLKRSHAAAEAQALPLVDGLYRSIPRDKTFSSAWWLSNTRTALLTEPREGAGVSATLPPQTWVEVAEDIAFVIPTRGVVLESGDGFGLAVCDIVYQIDSEDGEGASTKWVWHKARVFTLDQNDGHADAKAPRPPYIDWEWTEGETTLAPAAAARLGPWVRLKGQDGAVGWTRNGPNDFDCIWENDRILDGKPTKCARFPGAASAVRPTGRRGN